jgi:hypothetical protein
MDQVAPVSACTLAQVASRSAMVGGQRQSVAPWRAMLASLAATAPSGTTTWQGMPRVRAASEGGAVVAGGMGDHAGTGAISIQRPHRVAGTAELECATALQVLGLERQLRAGQRIERARAQHRGHAGVRRDPRSSKQDVVGTGQQ